MVVSDAVEVAVSVPTVRFPIDATEATSVSMNEFNMRAKFAYNPAVVEVPLIVDDAAERPPESAMVFTFNVPTFAVVIVEEA